MHLETDGRSEATLAELRVSVPLGDSARGVENGALKFNVTLSSPMSFLIALDNAHPAG